MGQRERVARWLVAWALIVGTLVSGVATQAPQPVAAAPGQWTVTGAPMEGHKSNFTLTGLQGGGALLCGGVIQINTGGGGDHTYTTPHCEEYSTSMGTWYGIQGMTGDRAGHSATLLSDGRVLVAGGYHGDGSVATGTYSPVKLNTAEVFNPTNNTWTSTGPMPLAISGHQAVLLNDGRVLVVGAVGSETYDPSTNAWSIAASMSVQRLYFALVGLQDGTVLAVGGRFIPQSGSAVALNTAETYNPSNNVWTATSTMQFGRSDVSAARIPNSPNVLVSGGDTVIGANDQTTNTAEIYNPSTRSFTQTGNMNYYRSAHLTVPLPDGTVMVTGGFPTGAASDIYNPQSGAWTVSGTPHFQNPVGVVPITGNRFLSANPYFPINPPQDTSAEYYEAPAGTPAATLNTTSLTFGPHPVASRTTQSVLLSNTGTAPLSGISVSFSSPNTAGSFSVGDACSGQTLAPGSSCSVNVTFQPAAKGPYSGTLTFTYGATGSPQTVSVSGSGTSGFAMSPDSIDFGAQTVNTTSASRTITVTNASGASSQITSVNITTAGSGNGGFSGSGCQGQTLAPNGTCTISVSFDPGITGQFTGQVRVSDSSGINTGTTTLAGTGTNSNLPVLSWSPSPFDFGPVPDTGTSGVFADKLITFTNTGNQPLTLDNGNAGGPLCISNGGACNSGPNYLDYTVSDVGTCSGATLAPGGSCQARLRFTPHGTGSRPATLFVLFNTSANPAPATGNPTSVALSGTGTPNGTQTPLISVRPQFGTVFASQNDFTSSGGTNVFVYNTGTTNLTVSSIAADPNYGNPGDFTFTGCVTTITVSNSCTGQIVFRPTAPGARKARFIVSSNASNDNAVLVYVSGTGVGVPHARFSPFVVFDPVVAGGQTFKTFTITNDGDAPLAISGINYSGSFQSVGGGTCDTYGSTIPAGVSCTQNVRAFPQSAGSYSGGVTYTDNANNVSGSQQQVAFSGTATAKPPKVTAIGSPMSGPTAGGTQITLTGTDFSSTVSVLFGDTPGAVVGTPTSTSITVTSPAHSAATVNVTVINADGQTSSIHGFTFLPPNFVPTVVPHATATPQGPSAPTPLPEPAHPHSTPTPVHGAMPTATPLTQPMRH